MIILVIPQHDHSCNPTTSIKFASRKTEVWLRLRRNLVGVGEEGLNTSFLVNRFFFKCYELKMFFRYFENVLLVSTYSLLAMLSKETGVMILPIVIIYQLCCREGISTTLYRDKDLARTLLKYAATVRHNRCHNIFQ